MAERPMPDRRQTVRRKVRIGSTKVYFDTGLYDDGTIGELFIVVEKTGADSRWYYDEIARLASKLLQHGCPLEQVAEGWLGTRGKICGTVYGDPQIKMATSVLDYIGRHLLVAKCGRLDLAHVKGQP